MVIPVKYAFIFLISGALSAGATFFLGANFQPKVILFLVFFVVTFTSLKDLAGIKDLRKAISQDSHKKSRNWEEILSGIVLIIWFFQLPEDLTLPESIIWISSNALCLVCTIHIVFKTIHWFKHS